jgi:hypothetical protein
LYLLKRSDQWLLLNAVLGPYAFQSTPDHYYRGRVRSS